MKNFFLSIVAIYLFISLTSSTMAGPITAVYLDGAGVGFNDGSAAITPAPGNTGTTLGAQRKQVLEAALAFWGTTLNNQYEIKVSATFSSDNAVISCTADEGSLAFAGPTAEVVKFQASALPLSTTLYPVALAQELTGLTTLVPSEGEGANTHIIVTFNGRIGTSGCITLGGWYYGLTGTAPTGKSSMYGTAVHEIAHGLGFGTYVDANGQKPNNDGVFYDDVFMLHLKDNSTGKFWSTMTDAERAASFIDTGDLIWDGANVTEASAVLTAGKIGTKVRMYAPNPMESGSSVSHFDTTLTPDELMEPYDTPTTIDTLTKAVMCDIGWKGPACLTINTVGTIAISGAAQVGKTLTATVTDPNNFVASTVIYQWSANNAVISGATGNTYVPIAAQVGQTITVKATYKDSAGNTEAPVSVATTTIIAAAGTATGTPTVSSGGQPIPTGTTTPAVGSNSHFGTQPLTEGKGSKIYRLTNPGAAPVTVDLFIVEVESIASVFPLSIKSLLASLNPIKDAMAIGAGDFTVTPTSQTIPTGGSVDYTVNFQPTTSGLREAYINFSTNGAVFNRVRVAGIGAADNPAAVNIPVFGPLGLMAILASLLFFGSRRRNKA